MHNQTGRGLTRQDKTRERMAQERSSPGATTAGGNESATPQPKADTDPTLSVAGKDLETSDNSASRRDDSVTPGGSGASTQTTTEGTAMKDIAQAIDKPMVESRSRDDRIREAAYLRYLARGDNDGDASADWLAAELAVDEDEREG